MEPHCPVATNVNETVGFSVILLSYIDIYKYISGAIGSACFGCLGLDECSSCSSSHGCRDLTT